MSARGYWDRMLVYFGIAEEADEDDMERPERERRTPRDTGGDPEREPAPRRRAPARRSTSQSASSGSGRRSQQSVAGVGIVPPRTFNDAQSIADQFKRGLPVIVNLQETGNDLAKRIIDFASGLTYGLDGGVSQIADRVFLLTPPEVEVSAEDQAEILGSGFFNQS